MSEKKQLEMFGPEETLPLFTGTPIRGEIEVFDPGPAVRQLPFGCPICKGTGEVVDSGRRRRCTCAVGTEIHRLAGQGAQEK